MIFVGDLIDRGDDHRGVLTTVKAMVDAGTAQMVMGNHEFNAVCFATIDPSSGLFLREHSDKNVGQHDAFRKQLSAGEQAHWIEWFKTLPLWLDLGALRIIHACWHNQSIELLRGAAGFKGNTFPDDIDSWVRANTKHDSIWEAIEILLKGPEIKLEPYGLPEFRDPGGQMRGEARAAWWRPGATTLDKLIDANALTELEDGTPYPTIETGRPCEPRDRSFAYSDDVPVAYGHHWREWAPKEHIDWTDRTACVDFSAAKGGPLVAYQWRGESMIDPTHFERYPAELR